MVTQVTDYIYSLIGELLKNGNYYERTMSRYAYELCNATDGSNEGKYKKHRLNLKFEEFLWWIFDIVNDNNMYLKLINSLFYCEGKQFNHNHTALAKLLTEGKIPILLTTNFDNCVELVDPSINHITHTSVDLLDKLKENYGKINIVKLHGDITNGSYISTIPNLLKARKAKEHSYLLDIVKNRNLLIIGYSGFGDIDISAQLLNINKEKTNVVWMQHKKVTNEKDLHPAATHWFFSDLSKIDESKNWLLKLASISAQDFINNDFPDWKQRCKQWFSELNNSQLCEIVERFYRDRLGISTGYARNHMVFVKVQSRRNDNYIDYKKNFDLGRAAIQIAAYKTSLRYLKEAKKNSTNIDDSFVCDHFIAFSEWGFGKSEKAEELFRKLMNDSRGKNEDIYTEASREWFNVVRSIIKSKLTKEKRKKYFLLRGVNEVYLDLFNRLENNTVLQLQTKLQLLDMQNMLGERVDFKDVLSIYTDYDNLQYYGHAHGASIVLMKIDFIQGDLYFRLVDKKIREEQNSILIFKGIIAQLEMRSFIFRLINVYLGPIISIVSTYWTEFKFCIKRGRWYRNFYRNRIIYE